MKKILTYLFFLLLLGYLVTVVIYASGVRRAALCTGVVCDINSKDGICLLDDSYVQGRLRRTFGDFEGKPVAEIDLDSIVRFMKRIPLIKDVGAYVSQGGMLNVNIFPREPMFRVFPDKGGDYIVDRERNIIKISGRIKVRTMTVTGKVTEKMLKGEIYDLVRILAENPLWNAMFEQIHLRNDGNIVLIPKIGDMRVVLGDAEDIRLKLDNFKLYLEQGIDKKGWIPYKELNLSYRNQVIGVKR